MKYIVDDVLAQKIAEETSRYFKEEQKRSDELAKKLREEAKKRAEEKCQLKYG